MSVANVVFMIGFLCFLEKELVGEFLFYRHTQN